MTPPRHAIPRNQKSHCPECRRDSPVTVESFAVAIANSLHASCQHAQVPDEICGKAFLKVKGSSASKNEIRRAGISAFRLWRERWQQGQRVFPCPKQS